MNMFDIKGRAMLSKPTVAVKSSSFASPHVRPHGVVEATDTKNIARTLPTWLMVYC